MKKGFDRLKSVAAAGVVGLGAMAAGSGRASSVAMPVTVTVTASSTTIGTWVGAGNASNMYVTTAATQTTGWFTYSGFTATGFKFGQLSFLTTGSSTRQLFWTGSGLETSMGLMVDGTVFANPTGSVDLTDDILTTGVHQDINGSGVDAQIELYYVPGERTLRYSFILTNNGPSEATTDVRTFGYFDSDNQTTVQASSDGDLVVDNTDNWFVLNDSTTPASDGGWAIFMTKAGAEMVIAPGIGDQGNTYGGFMMKYNVTIPVGETVRVVNYLAVTPTIADGVGAGAVADSPTEIYQGGYLTGMTNAEIVQVANYNFDANGDGTADFLESAGGGGGGGGGSLGLPALLSGLGLWLFGRIRRERS